MSIRPHRTLVGLLLILGTLTAILGAGSWWARRDVLNTARWTRTSERLIADPAVRRGVSRLVVSRLLGAGGVDAALDRTLGTAAGGEAGRVLRRAATGPADSLLKSRGGRAAWRQANREAVSGLLAAADHPARRRGVSLELTPLLTALVRAVLDVPAVRAIPGSASVLALHVPAAGRRRLFTPAQAHHVGRLVRAMRTLAWALPLAALVSFLLAWLLARSWRTIALRRAGYGLFLAGLAVIGLRAGLQYAIAGAAGAGADRPAIRAAWLIAAAPLRGEGLGMLVAGAAVAAFAWVARFALR